MSFFVKFKVLLSSGITTKSVIGRYNFHRSFCKCSKLQVSYDIQKPFYITRTFQSDPDTLTVEFADSLTAKFPYVWLRDSCRCNKCYTPKTQQKLFDTASLQLDITPKFCHVTNTNKLKLVWPDGHNEHVSFYPPEWLYRYAVGFEKDLYEAVHDCLPEVECWVGETLQVNLPEMGHEKVMQSQTGVNVCLQNIHKYGIQIIKNVPCEPGEVIRVMNRIACIKSTRWGSLFHITTDDTISDRACLKKANDDIDFHTDMDYLEKSPGIQAVHCMETQDGDTDEKSGNLVKSYFVDGFFIARWMKENYPVYFETLATVPVKFQLIRHNMHYANYQPILKLSSSRQVTEVHFNNRMRAPLEGPSRTISKFYSAYKMFSETVKKPEHCFSMTLEPGDLVIRNTRRVLHGRNILKATKMTRHLEGCYGDVDEVLARYRSFLMKKYSSVAK